MLASPATTARAMTSARWGCTSASRLSRPHRASTPKRTIATIDSAGSLRRAGRSPRSLACTDVTVAHPAVPVHVVGPAPSAACRHCAWRHVTARASGRPLAARTVPPASHDRVTCAEVLVVGSPICEADAHDARGLLHRPVHPPVGRARRDRRPPAPGRVGGGPPVGDRLRPARLLPRRRSASRRADPARRPPGPGQDHVRPAGGPARARPRATRCSTSATSTTR